MAETTTQTAVPIKVPQFRSFVDKDDFRALEAVFENNYIAEGPFAKQFQQQLLQIIGAQHGVFACNGTLAIYLALKALGVKPGDEFIVQNVTFIASANGVEMAGCKPIFADIVSFDDMSIDLDRIQLTPRTRGIVVAHLYGTACSNIEEVRQYCLDNDLWLVEDAAQALAITDGYTHCGMFGDIGTFSFYADKTITTAEGGFIVTRHADVYERLVYLRNQGRKQSGTFVHPEIGYNFRITDLQAALGLSQLKKLDYIKAKKAELYQWYREFLGDRVQFLKINPDFNHIPFRVVAFVPDAETSMKYMREQGIESRSMFYPLHRQPCYENLGGRDSDFPNSNECFRRGMNLPTWVGLTREQVEYTANALIESLDA
ncbi:MAG: DegT/DnrJ/EryC1/StrS family aminotransferase [Pirellulaceae bacterium]